MDDKLLDPVNLKILGLLQQNGRLPLKEISERVYKSETPVGLRIRRLQEEGVILGYSAILDRHKLGRTTMVITQVRLNRYAPQLLEDFGKAMQLLPEVQFIVQVAGEFDFLMQLTFKNAADYETFLSEKLGAMPCVERVNSVFVLKDYKLQAALPLF